jgi:ABC-type transporter Mla maintaining outer membrane lipid asymmetry ATPase subunit MlaF
LNAGKIEWQGSPEEALNTTDPYMNQFAHATSQGPMLLEGGDL